MRIIVLSVALFFSLVISAQEVTVNGYVYETGNRGYLNQVEVDIVKKTTGESISKVSTNAEGYFELTLPADQDYVAYSTKQLFEKKTTNFDTRNVENGKKKFLKIQMDREPGYDFEVTLAPKRNDENIPVDAIKGAWIEVYNNTTQKEILNLMDHPELEFNVHFEKGNHYTIMVRKDGFLTKRMEAYVNIEGCILCFDGVGSVQPGVVDNLSDGNEMGVLLANVEMEPLFTGKTFKVENLYYDFGKATLRPDSKKALKNLATVLNDNPHIHVELGSHTDSRGNSSDNMKLSERRAKSAVDYLTGTLDVSPRVIQAAGYGETDPFNNCTDGVDCTEAQHQENRRTEIKVLNIINANREKKTLAEIRVEEEFMKGLFSEGLETKVEGNNEAKQQESSSKKETEKIIEQETKVYEEPVREVEKVIVEVPSQTEKSKMQDVSEKSSSTVEKKTIRVKEKDQEKFIEVETMTNEKVETHTSESKDHINGDLNSQRNLYNELRQNRRFGDYTGYKIVIQFSRLPLSEDHEIFGRHDDLKYYKTPSGSILYMIGDFEDEKSADDFLYKTVSTMYPGAYIVQFENGTRLK